MWMNDGLCLLVGFTTWPVSVAGILLKTYGVLENSEVVPLMPREWVNPGREGEGRSLPRSNF